MITTSNAVLESFIAREMPDNSHADAEPRQVEVRCGIKVLVTGSYLVRAGWHDGDRFVKGTPTDRDYIADGQVFGNAGQTVELALTLCGKPMFGESHIRVELYEPKGGAIQAAQPRLARETDETPMPAIKATPTTRRATEVELVGIQRRLVNAYHAREGLGKEKDVSRNPVIAEENAAGTLAFVGGGGAFILSLIIGGVMVAWSTLNWTYFLIPLGGAIGSALWSFFWTRAWWSQVKKLEQIDQEYEEKRIQATAVIATALQEVVAVVPDANVPDAAHLNLEQVQHLLERIHQIQSRSVEVVFVFQGVQLMEDGRADLYLNGKLLGSGTMQAGFELTAFVARGIHFVQFASPKCYGPQPVSLEFADGGRVRVVVSGRWADMFSNELYINYQFSYCYE